MLAVIMCNPLITLLLAHRDSIWHKDLSLTIVVKDLTDMLLTESFTQCPTDNVTWVAKQNSGYNCSLVTSLMFIKKTSMRLQVIMAVSMEMSVFWDFASCNLVDTDFSEKLAAASTRVMSALWIVSQYLPDYIVYHPQKTFRTVMIQHKF